MQWCERELTAIERRPPEPLFSVGTGAQPLFVNRQPSTVVKRQPGLQPAIDPEMY